MKRPYGMAAETVSREEIFGWTAGSTHVLQVPHKVSKKTYLALEALAKENARNKK